MHSIFFLRLWGENVRRACGETTRGWRVLFCRLRTPAGVSPTWNPAAGIRPPPPPHQAAPGGGLSASAEAPSQPEGRLIAGRRWTAWSLLCPLQSEERGSLQPGVPGRGAAVTCCNRPGMLARQLPTPVLS